MINFPKTFWSPKTFSTKEKEKKRIEKKRIEKKLARPASPGTHVDIASQAKSHAHAPRPAGPCTCCLLSFSFLFSLMYGAHNHHLPPAKSSAPIRVCSCPQKS
jgi:hypothetical protein